MEEAHSAKRRRLNAGAAAASQPPKSSPAQQHAASPPPRPRSTRTPKSTPAVARVTLSGHSADVQEPPAAMAATTGSSTGRKRQAAQTSANVYDDIEGALASPSTANAAAADKRMATNGHPVDSPAASTPVTASATKVPTRAPVRPTHANAKENGQKPLSQHAKIAKEAAVQGSAGLLKRLQARMGMSFGFGGMPRSQSSPSLGAPPRHQVQDGTPAAPVVARQSPGGDRPVTRDLPLGPAKANANANKMTAEEQRKFEDEQLERALKRKPKKSREEELREREEARARRKNGRKTKSMGGTESVRESSVAGDSVAGTPAAAKKVTKATPKSALHNAVDERNAESDAVDDDDDVPCKVCGKRNSPKLNPIVLCDGCEKGYHKKCHEPPIPKRVIDDEDGEWFCAECSADPEVAQRLNNDRDGEEVDDLENVQPGASAAPRPQSRDGKRALSPMVLDVPASRRPPTSPSKMFSPMKRRNLAPQAPPEPKRSLGMAIDSTDLDKIKHFVLGQLTGHRAIPLIGLDVERAKVAALINQTISAGESNSMLLIGARGSGKTTMIEDILREQDLKNKDAFHVVRLNGFIHTDDKLALRETMRQLGRELDPDDPTAVESKNYADTMTTLLALLSSPEDLGLARAEGTATKSVVFVLDEFDLFATHPRQTLLYNLFDIAQSRKAPIAVLGCTTRFDASEMLEKRVKSRFSHRFVHFSLAKDLETFKKMCQSSLLPSANIKSSEDSERGLAHHLDDMSVSGLFAWDALINDLMGTDAFIALLQRIYYTSKSVPAFHAAVHLAFSTMPTHPPKQPTPSPDDANNAPPPADALNTDPSHISTSTLLIHLTSPTILLPTRPPDSKLPLLPTLTTLQLSLLIAACRLAIIHSSDLVSFALAYNEYVALASRARIQASASGSLVSGGGVGRVWGMGVARGAWEGLVEGGLVVVEGGGAGGAGKGKGEDGVLGRVDVALEEVGEVMAGEMPGVMVRWCREI